TVFFFFFYDSRHHHHLPSFPTRRSSDLLLSWVACSLSSPMTWFDMSTCPKTRATTFRSTRCWRPWGRFDCTPELLATSNLSPYRSEEHTSELQSRSDLVCRLLLEKKKKK